MKSTAQQPITPLIDAPSKRIGKDLPSNPRATETIKAIPTPGSMAWESVSPIKERFRKSRNPPISPQAQPSKSVQITTNLVL